VRSVESAGGVVRYVRIYPDAGGRSHFEDVEAEMTEQRIADGVPPVLVSQPFPVSALVFVEQQPDAPDWDPHVAPRRQWVMALRGRAAITVSTGERREFGPGEPILVEDTDGEGHISTPLTDDLAFLMMPAPQP
jgi:hypothetical protein